MPRPIRHALYFAALVAIGWLPAAATADEPRYLPNDSRQWSRAGEAKILADWSQAEPRDKLVTGRREKGKWKVIPFETADLKGQALSTLRSTEAPVVRLPLATKGWHAVYVGVCTVSAGLDKADDNGLEAKLSSETVFRRMSNGLPLLKPRRDQIQEIFLTVADLTGQSLEVKPKPFQPSTICYTKLVPLTAAETEDWQSPGNTSATRTSIATFDGHSWIWPYHPRTAEDLQATFRGLERSDFKKWWFQVLGADLVCYPSKIGTVPGEGTQDFCRWEYEEFTRAIEALAAKGISPLKVAREEAARQGAEFHVMIRPTGWHGSYPWDEIFNSRFFDEHPEWRCVDRDGTPTLHMSYAVPEVRKHVLDVLRETLEIQPDGVGFLFHRGMPMILWEDAFSNEFQAKYNANARTVPEDDPRILELRAEIMTRFMKEVRAMLDETASRQKRSKPYTISLATFSTEKDNRKFGLDVERWIGEKLVDELGIAWFAHHTSFGPPDVKYYHKITAGTGVKVYPFVIAWHSGSPQQLCQKVTQSYADGADGIAVWDPSIEAHYRDGSPGNVFDVASKLGHRKLIAEWAAKGVPTPLMIPLTRLGENYYSRWFPNTGY